MVHSAAGALFPSSSSSRRLKDYVSKFKTVIALFIGFYLGGLHSSFYVTHQNELPQQGGGCNHQHPNAAVSSSGAASKSNLRPESDTQRKLQSNLEHCEAELKTLYQHVYNKDAEKQSQHQQQPKQQHNQLQLSSLQQQQQQQHHHDNDLQQELDECETEVERLLHDLQDHCEQDNAPRAVVKEPFNSVEQQQHATIPKKSTNPLCQRFPFLAKESALSVWLDHVPAIHRASQLKKNDIRYVYSDFTAQLLEVVTPRLPRTILNLPLDWTVVDRILKKIDARYRYLKEGGPAAPPVKIVVMGGSILIGRNCRKLNKDLNIQFPLPNRECTYAHRLQKFLDLIVGSGNEDGGGNGTPDLFQVTKIAMGGTNTAVGSQVFLYDLLPEEAQNPDIVMNAYATNDMHVLTAMEAATGNQTLGQRVFEMTQEFVRNVMEEKPCRDKPLLIHMDDYLGNEQREILATMQLSQYIGSLADYYGFNRISYANLVRDIVYGDTREFWFSPEGWWPPKAKNMEREIHPGMGMHIVAQWVIAYDMLNLATTFCSMEDYWHEPALQDYQSTKFSDLIPLRGAYSNIPGKPKSPPGGLPPNLTPSLNLEFVSELWRSADVAKETVACDKAPRSRCVFSWISGLSTHQNNVTWVTEIFNARATESKGWKLVDEGGKKGYMPTNLGDKMVLEFPNLSQSIGSVTFFIMKSYGEKWEGSRLSVSVSEKSGDNADWRRLSERDLVGVHAKNTSETYPETLSLGHAVQPGSSLQVSYELTGGKTFKIMGLAVCS